MHAAVDALSAALHGPAKGNLAPHIHLHGQHMRDVCANLDLGTCSKESLSMLQPLLHQARGISRMQYSLR